MALFGGSRAGDAALAARYKHLLTVAKALTSERDFKRVLAVVMDTIVELTGAERAFVWLGGAEEGRVEVARNFEKENVRKPASKVSRSIIKQAIDRGEPILTDNASADATFMDSVVIPLTCTGRPFRTGFLATYCNAVARATSIEVRSSSCKS